MVDTIHQFTYQEQQPSRLDVFLVVCMPDFSRTRLQALIKDGFVSINGNLITKSGFPLSTGDSIRLELPPLQPSDVSPENIPLDIIFEDKNILVINKPAGMVVHPSAGHATGTLVNAALAHDQDIVGVGGEIRPGVVHRLDKDTSGIILFAKNDKTHHWLQDQFRLRKVQKIYLALVEGHPPTPYGRIDAPVGRDPSLRKKMAIVPIEKGRSAITEYKTIESFPSHTLIEAHPITGRTHQIRLHLAFIGCPIVGDQIYGKKKSSLSISRQFLHAASLQIHLPEAKTSTTFSAPLPDELEFVLSELRKTTHIHKDEK